MWSAIISTRQRSRTCLCGQQFVFRHPHSRLTESNLIIKKLSSQSHALHVLFLLNKQTRTASNRGRVWLRLYVCVCVCVYTRMYSFNVCNSPIQNIFILRWIHKELICLWHYIRECFVDYENKSVINSALYAPSLLSVTGYISLWKSILACANCSTAETVELCIFIYVIGRIYIWSTIFNFASVMDHLFS
jgi:hypothetical protein